MPKDSAIDASRASPRRARFLWSCGIFLLSLALFAPTLAYDFVWDDLSLLVTNPRLSDWSLVFENLTSNVFHEPQERGTFDYWRPLVVLSHMVEKSLFGEGPVGAHAVNVLLHACVALLVFLFGLSLFGRKGPAAAAAMLFAVHPIHVEVVAWVSGRSDLLFGLFFIAALACEWQALRRAPSVHWRAMSLAAFLAALLSKEAAAIFPALVGIAAWLQVPADRTTRARIRAILTTTWPSMALLGLYLWVRLGVLHVEPSRAATEALDRAVLFWTWWEAFLAYTWLLIWPADLTIVHDIGTASGPASVPVMLGMVVFSGMCWAIWSLRRRSPGASFGWSIYLVGMIPISNFIVRIGSHPGVAFPFAERFVYVPSVGLCLVLGWWFIQRLPEVLAARVSSEESTPNLAPARVSCAAMWTLVALLVLAGTWKTVDRCRIWKDESTLFGAAVLESPDSAVAHLNLGAVLEARARAAADSPQSLEMLQAAALHYRRARDLNPDNYRSHYNLGNLDLLTGDLESAERSYRRALTLHPDLYHALTNLGTLLARKGEFEQALDMFERADRAVPGQVSTLVNRANVLATLGRFDEAIQLFEAALEIDPGLYAARVGLERARQDRQAQVVRPTP